MKDIVEHFRKANNNEGRGDADAPSDCPAPVGHINQGATQIREPQPENNMPNQIAAGSNPTVSGRSLAPRDAENTNHINSAFDLPRPAPPTQRRDLSLAQLTYQHIAGNPSHTATRSHMPPPPLPHKRKREDDRYQPAPPRAMPAPRPNPEQAFRIYSNSGATFVPCDGPAPPSAVQRQGPPTYPPYAPTAPRQAGMRGMGTVYGASHAHNHGRTRADSAAFQADSMQPGQADMRGGMGSAYGASHTHNHSFTRADSAASQADSMQPDEVDASGESEDDGYPGDVEDARDEADYLSRASGITVTTEDGLSEDGLPPAEHEVVESTEKERRGRRTR